MKGTVFVISAPSGAGKNTVIKKYLETAGSSKGMVVSVSVTTRQPRQGEIDGRHYHFFTKEKFRDYIKKGKFLEYARVLDNYYGTLKETVISSINKGKNVIMDVDVQGGRSIKKRLKNDAITVFIIPPSLKELEKRLKGRKTESPQAIRKRLELGKKELKERKKYDYIVVNDTVEEAVKHLDLIVRLETEEKRQSGTNGGRK